MHLPANSLAQLVAHAITSNAPAPGEPIRRSEADAPAPDVASMISDWEHARRTRTSVTTAESTAREAARNAAGLARSLAELKDQAIEKAGELDHFAGQVLHRIGPQVVGGWRYEGVMLGGLWCVVKTPVGQFAYPDGAHAACCCEVRDDDGETD